MKKTIIGHRPDVHQRKILLRLQLVIAFIRCGNKDHRVRRVVCFTVLDQEQVVANIVVLICDILEFFQNDKIVHRLRGLHSLHLKVP